MRKTLLALALTAFSTSAMSDNNTIGNTYPIKEQSMLEYIIEKLKEKESSGEMAKMQEEFKEKAIASLNNPKGIDLPKAEKNSTRIFDTTSVVTKDIVMPDGRVMHKAGTQFNPLLIKSLSKKLIFIDGRDKAQVDFAINEYEKTGKVDKIVLVAGSYIELMKERKVRFFFDQQYSGGGEGQRLTLVKRFNIKALPSIVFQESPTTPYLTINEVSL
ncbi:MAG: hypothetical protein JXK16_00030 [Thiotrichales bacterium]|nr:hypothetical protein [Thiotrichales bacterium]